MNKLHGIFERILEKMECSGQIIEKDGPEFGITIHHDIETYKKVLKEREEKTKINKNKGNS